MASLNQIIQDAQPDATDPTAGLPRFSPSAMPQGSTTRNAIGAGLSTGVDQLQGMGGAFVAAVGDLLGSKNIKDWGIDVANRNSREAAANGRSDLDKPLWEVNPGQLPGWLAYRTAQQVPQWATQLLGGAVVGRGLRAAGLAVPEAAGELAARAPKALGGGGFGINTVGPIAKDVLQEGKNYATDVAGAAVAGYPMAVGSMYGEAIDRGDPNRGDAAKAAILGPAYAALDALEPAFLKNKLLKGSTGGLATRLLTGVFGGAALEMPQEAVQTAMEQSFRPDLSPMDKFRNIVDAAVTGGVVGGFAGGIGGIRRAKSPSEVTDDELKQDMDAAMSGNKGPAPALTLTPGLQPQDGGVAEPAAPRPFGKEPLERVQSMLSDVESRLSSGGGTQADAANRNQLREEVAARIAEQQPERPFAKVPDIDLNNALEAATAKNQPDMATAIQQELAARQADAQQMQAAVKIGPNQRPEFEPRTPELPGLNLQDQVTPAIETAQNEQRQAAADRQIAERQAAQQQTVEQVHQELADLAGLKSVPKNFTKLGIQTREEGLGYVADRLQQGNAPKWVMEAGKKIGLLDEEGNDQSVDDLKAKLAQVQDRISNSFQRFGDTKAQYNARINLQKQQTAISQQIEMAQQAQDAAIVVQQKKNPPTEIAPGPARLRGPQGNYSEVQVLEKAPIKQGDTLFQPVRTSQGQEVNVPIASLFPSAPSKAEAVTPSPVPTEAQTARKPPPLNPKEPSNGPIPNELKSPLWQNNPVAQREGLTPLRGEGEAAAAIGRSSEVAPRSIAAAPAALTAEETQAAARDISRYEPVLGEIVSNKELPVTMRRAAREARDQLREGTGYREAVDQVLADYSAHTGDYQYSTDPAEQAAFGKRQEAFKAPSNKALVDQVLDRRGLLDPTQREALRNRALQMLEEDAQGFASNPEGPFKGATENVVASESVDPRYGMFLKDLMHTMGLGNVRVFMFHPEDVRDGAKYGLHGPFNSATIAERRGGAGGVSPFGIGDRDFYMVIKPGMSAERTIEVIAHELGHMVWHIALAKASPEVKAAIRAEYMQWRAKNRNSTAQQLIKALRNRYGAAANIESMEERLRNQVIPNAEEYWLSEGEWFADQVSRWATTSAKPLSVVEKFFSKIGQMMKAILKYSLGQGFLPAQSVKEFLDNMGPTSTPFNWEGFKGKYSLMADTTLSATPTLDSMLDSIGKATPQALHSRLQQIMTQSDNVLSRLSNLPWKEATNNLNKLHLYATTLEHITKFFGPLFKPGTLEKYRDLHVMQRSVQGRLAHLMAIPYQQWETLQSANKKAGQGVLDLMHFTFGDIDPRKRWEEHEHLHGVKDSVLKQRVAEANKLYSEMSRIIVNGQRVSSVYDNFVAANESDRYSAQTVALYNLINANAAIDQQQKNAMRDPMQQYMQNASIYEDVNASRQYWKDARDSIIKSISDYIAAQEGRLGTLSKAEANKIKSDNTSLVGLLKEIDQQDDAMKRAPYFHVGRFGNYFASFRLTTDEQGNVPQANLERVADLINKGKFALSVPMETVKDRIFARFETQDETDRFEKLMTQLERDKLLTRDPRKGSKEGQEPKLGQRGETPISDEPVWAQSLISSMRQHFEESAVMDDLSAEEIAQRKKLVDEYANHVRSFFQNMIPDASILKVNLQRYGIAGFTSDMMRSYAFRSSLGAEALAGTYISPQMTDAMKEIRAQVDDMKVLGETGAKQRYTAQNVLFELLKREANRAVMNRNSFFDAWRAVNHNFWLGLSPSFVLTQMVQIPAYLWPRLAAKHGYVNSFEAIRQVTPTAFRILRATIQHGYEGSWVQALDATINTKVLEKAKVPASDREFILRMANSGLLDMGSQSRELGRVTEGRQKSNFDVAMRIASSFGFYSEMLGRVISALAAKKLYDGPAEGLEKYAHDVVSSSMFEFSNWNTSRAMGRHGVLGAATPVAAAFKSYTQQVLETLTREIHSAYVDKAATPQQKTEARRFLGAHLAAMTFFAGSLGMPAASMVAVVMNNLVDILGDDDEPFDAKIAYRRFLASIFGKGVGEVLARGVPRAIGFDISQRTGEADILPFSRLLSDRRQWSDAFKDYAFNMLGSPVSMASNIIDGALAVGQGDLIDGAKKMMPQAVKGGIEAYKLTSRGYQDQQGNLLPMEPGALDIMYQLLGVTPAGRAEYDEERRAYQATRGQMIRKASDYRKELATAIEDGDTETASQLIADIKRFDEMNPSYAVLPTIGQTIARRARDRASAMDAGAPLGVPSALQEQYSFGNVR